MENVLDPNFGSLLGIAAIVAIPVALSGILVVAGLFRGQFFGKTNT